MTEPWTGRTRQEGWTRAIAALREFVPQRFRRDRPVVPVLRLTGVIGLSTPLRPGLSMAGIARALDRAVRGAQRRRGRARHQFAGRFAGAIASDLPPHPRSGEGKKPPRDRVCRGRRRLGRLHDRLRRRRDHRRSEFHRRLDRRGRRLVRFRQADRQDRHRAPALYVGRTQSDARSVPAGGSERRRTAEDICSGKSTTISSRW